jgi:hypothetical protein
MTAHADARWLLLGDCSWDAWSFPATFADDVIDKPAKAQFEVFLDEHCGALNRCLDGLTEDQVRRSLVPSRTTLPYLPVRPSTVVEVDVDTAYEHGKWRHRARFVQIRADLAPSDVPLY